MEIVNTHFRNIELSLLDTFRAMATGLGWWFENQTLIEIVQQGTITLEHGYIEIGMLRNSYEKFIHKCHHLKHPYVLKSFANRMFPRGYAKLVNVETTAIVAKEGIFDVEDIAQGMFLLVYPFDKISIHDDFQTECKVIAKLRADAVNNFIHWKNGFIVEDEWLAYGTRYNDYLTRNNPSDSNIVANLTLATSRGYTDIRYLDDIEHLETITWDNMKGYIPRDAKDIVSRLKLNQTLNEHITLLDTDKAYTEHLFKPITMTDEEFLSNLKIPVGNDFLKEEIRCGYTVTSKMKRQWALCLDLLSELDRVCQCNNIKWYADGGTLLGAARHKGFIPWDDDIDVMLLREDYDTLLSCADQFKGRYFLQTFETDYVCKSKARLINTASSVLTTFQSIHSKRHQEKQGCFIDIFPLDHIKSDDQWADLCRRRIDYLRAASMYKSQWLAFGDEAAKENMIQSYAAFDAITKEGKASGKTKYGANLGFLQASRFLKREMEDYDDIVYLPFENMKLPCPVGYKRCLDYIYGKDWNVFKKGLACHNIWKYDTDTPWEAYCDYYKRCQTDNKAKIAIETSQNCSTKT